MRQQVVGSDARLPAAHLARLAESRRVLVEAIGTDQPVTFVRAAGNVGDELIWAGARQLLGGLDYRELGPGEALRAADGTAVLAGSGGWCRPYHDLMPSLLGALDERFARVVLLPSSFDLEVPAVREALARTRAVVFAREPESWRLGQEVCDCRLALDTAFFFDFSPYFCEGSGDLLALRTDHESSQPELPVGNRDLSLLASSLDEWLWAIARCAGVRTDRLHVAIAAALLGKDVRVHPSSYHKIPSLSRWALEGFAVHCAEETQGARWPLRAASPTASSREVRGEMVRAASRKPVPTLGAGAVGESLATFVVISWQRQASLLRTLDSIAASVDFPHRIVVVDNGSEEGIRSTLRLRADEGRLELVLLERNVGCAVARTLGVERVKTPFVIFLDDDIELLPGAAARMLEGLQRHPETLAVTSCVVFPDGIVHFCGGTFRADDGVLDYSLGGVGCRFDAAELGSSGPCSWVAGGATAFHTEALRREPLDAQMGAYYEDFEWCFRQRHRPSGAFRRCVEALVIHHHEPKITYGEAAPRYAPGLLEAMARFLDRYGLVWCDLFLLVPELCDGEGRRNIAAARLLLELVRARGAGWVLAEWMDGGLAPLVGAAPRPFVPGPPEPNYRLHAQLIRGLAPAPLPTTGAEPGALVLELQEARRAAEGAQEALAAVHGSRWWSLADRYWRLRRLVGPMR